MIIGYFLGVSKVNYEVSLKFDPTKKTPTLMIYI